MVPAIYFQMIRKRHTYIKKAMGSNVSGEFG